MEQVLAAMVISAAGDAAAVVAEAVAVINLTHKLFRGSHHF